MVPCGTTSNGKGSKPMMFNIHGWREVHASAFFKEKYIGTYRNYCNIQDLVSAEKHATETSIFDWYCNLQISPGRFPQVNVSGLSMVHSCAAGRRAVSLAIEASKPNFSDGSRYPEMPGSWELIDGLAARWSPNPLAEVVTRLSLVGRWAEWRWLDHLQLWRILLSESTTVGTIWQWNISYKPPWLVRGFYFAVFAGKYFSIFFEGDPSTLRTSISILSCDFVAVTSSFDCVNRWMTHVTMFHECSASAAPALQEFSCGEIIFF